MLLIWNEIVFNLICAIFAKLISNHDLVPTVSIGSSFKYLGRYFSFSMGNAEHRSILIETINDLLCAIDKIPSQSKNKLLLYHRYVLSKISWHLTIADLSKTWVIENKDNKAEAYVRLWLELPISIWSNVQQKLPKNIFDFSLKYIKTTCATPNASQSDPCLNYQHVPFAFNLKL